MINNKKLQQLFYDSSLLPHTNGGVIEVCKNAGVKVLLLEEGVGALVVDHLSRNAVGQNKATA